MAVPTLTSITPASGHPGGRELVEIIGTNFALPPDPPATGYVGGSYPESVEIEFNGQAAIDVRVWTDQLITCLVPPYRDDPSVLNADPGFDVDVVIRNIGPPIEEDTFTDAFTYKRTDLARGDSVLRYVVRTLVRELRRQVINDIMPGKHIDFDGDPADSLDIVELARVPAIALFGPDIIEDKYRRSSAKPTTSSVSVLEFEKKRPARISILRFTATLTAKGQREGLNLSNEFIEFFNRYPRLVVDVDSTDSSAGTVEFDMFLTDGPSRSGSANDDQVAVYDASFEIHGVPIDSDVGARIEWGKMLDDPPNIDTAYEQKDG